jgi:hypothetical protein
VWVVANEDNSQGGIFAVDRVLEVSTDVQSGIEFKHEDWPCTMFDVLALLSASEGILTSVPSFGT